MTPTMTPTLTPTLTSTLPSPTFRLVCNQPASCCGFATRSPTLTSTLIPTMTPTMTPTLTSTLPSPTFRLVCNQPASCCGFATRSPTLTSTLIPTMTPTMTPTFRLVCNQPASCCGFATRAVLCFLCFPGSQTRPRELAGCKPARTWEKRGNPLTHTGKDAVPPCQTAHIASPNSTYRKPRRNRPQNGQC